MRSFAEIIGDEGAVEGCRRRRGLEARRERGDDENGEGRPVHEIDRPLSLEGPDHQKRERAQRQDELGEDDREGG
jgi:hypothetical protein